MNSTINAVPFTTPFINTFPNFNNFGTHPFIPSFVPPFGSAVTGPTFGLPVNTCCFPTSMPPFFNTPFQPISYTTGFPTNLAINGLNQPWLNTINPGLFGLNGLPLFGVHPLTNPYAVSTVPGFGLSNGIGFNAPWLTNGLPYNISPMGTPSFPFAGYNPYTSIANAPYVNTTYPVAPFGWTVPGAPVNAWNAPPAWPVNQPYYNWPVNNPAAGWPQGAGPFTYPASGHHPHTGTSSGGPTININREAA